jgi:hypothetical protein
MAVGKAFASDKSPLGKTPETSVDVLCNKQRWTHQKSAI